MKVTKTVEKTDVGEVAEEVTVLTPKVYDGIKKAVQVYIPGLSALYFGLAQIWGLPNAEEVVGSAAVVTTFLGTVIGISSKRYNESDAPHDGELIVTEDGGGAKNFLLALEGDPELLANKQAISFKVRKNQVYDPTP